jgi:hypothetical protein
LPDKQVRRISIRKAGRQEKKHATTSFLLSCLFDRIISDREDGKLVIWNLQNDSVDK